MTSTFRQRLLASTLLVGAASMAAPAWAQPVDDDPAEVPIQVTIDPDAIDDEGTDTIIVTGSRIPRRDLTSTSPLTVVQDEEFQLSGSQNVESVINSLPQVVPSLTAFSNNPGNGAAILNLRGLGSSRNLVLVNGRRYMFYDANQIVDVNTIPQFLVESVDVITGGASAVYGSDAIAGVINFRLRDDINGVYAGAYSAITEEGDGHRWSLDLAIGSDLADGRGNVAVFGSYFNRDPIFQGDRPFSSLALSDGCIVRGSTNSRTGAGTPLRVPRGEDCREIGGERGNVAAGSSGTLGTTLFFGLEPFAFTFPPGTLGTEGVESFGAGIFQAGAGGAPGSLRPFDEPFDRYNYAPSNYLQIPQERWLLGGYGSFEITDGIETYGEIVFANNRVDTELAPTPFFDTVAVDVDSPFLNADAQAILDRLDANDDGFADIYIGRRLNEVGPRRSANDRNAFRAVAGLKGDFGGFLDRFNYDAYYLFARTRNIESQSGNVSRSATTQALRTELGPDGQLRCEDQSSGCVPLNLFGAGQISPEAADFIRINTTNTETSELQVGSASMAGTLGDWFGGGEIGLAIGVEWRDVFGAFQPDEALSSGDVAGFNAGEPTQGGYDVRELFGEVRVPIVTDGFISKFEVSAAGRLSDYSLDEVGTVETYALGAEFAPVRDITFRAQFQHAVRAPNVAELFAGQAQGFPSATDPCLQSGARNDPGLVDICVATGVPLAQIGSGQINTQIEGLFGGNPNLQEEESDTFTVGAILQPRFIPGLAVTVDYFDIEIENAISVLGGGVNNVLGLCLNTIRDPSSPFCQAINRNLGGTVDFVEVLNENIATFETSGVDLQVTYGMPVPFRLGSPEARLNFFFLGTWTDEYNFTPVAELPDEVDICANQFGDTCGTPLPEFKATSRLSYIDGGTTISTRVRYIGEVDNDQIINDDADRLDLANPTLDEEFYVDLTLSQVVRDTLTLTVGVNNLFDNKPPLGGNSTQQANTFPSVYDVLGRDFFVSAALRF